MISNGQIGTDEAVHENHVGTTGTGATPDPIPETDRPTGLGAGGPVHYLVGGFRISLGVASNTPGPRTHIKNFVRGLDQIGRDTELIVASSMPLMGRFATIKQSDYSGATGAKVWIADAVRMGAALWCGLNVAVRTSRLSAPDVIYERLSVLQSMTSFHVRRRSAVRIIEANGVLSRETARDRKVLKSERLARHLEQRVLRRADIVVAVSDRLADELVDFAGLRRDRILVVPNGVDERLASLPRTEHGGRVIGFVGSISAWQNLEELILAVSRVQSDARDQLHLEIIGDGAELPNLRDMVAREGLSDLVTFHGRMAQEDAFEVMTGWDIGIAGHQKSSSDTMYHSPLKLYEYAALGLSIVCTDSSDARSLAVSGADVHIFEDTDDFESTLAGIVSSERRDVESVEKSRVSVVRDHAWRERVGAVLDAAAALRPDSERGEFR